MGLNDIVYDAAKKGELCRLRRLLDHKRRDEVKTIVSTVTLDSTPLVVACLNGFVDVVKYLIEECHADVNQVGSVVVEEETIEVAPPLWCAAAAGHFDVIKLLVHHNASLNGLTKTSSTPLRAACFDGYFQIVKYLIENGADFEIANRYGHTCLMIACYKGHFQISEYLLQCGANVNRQSSSGNTALHDCVDSGNLALFKILLDNGAKFHTDSQGVTPIVSAALKGHKEIVEYLIAHTSCRVNEKIDALKLLGATFVDKNNQRQIAHSFWKRAILMHLQDSESSLIKPLPRPPIAVYINAAEVNTLDELEELILEPYAMQMQAILIRERILGPGHPDTTYYVQYRGAAYADSGLFDRCITLWMYALDVQQRTLEPLNRNIQYSLMSFAELFSCMIHDALEKSGQMLATHFRNVLNVFQSTIEEIKRAMLYPYDSSDGENSNLHHILVIAMHLVGLIFLSQPHLSKEDDFEFKQAVYTLVHLNPKTHKGWTPLHIACFKDSSSLSQYPVFSFPSAEVAEILLKVGASPNAIDCEHNTALHITALNEPCPEAVFKLLLSHGAHLDFRNKAGKTALQLCSAPLLDVYPLQFLNLQCVCAHVIHKVGIPFHGLVPKKLEEFLDGH